VDLTATGAIDQTKVERNSPDHGNEKSSGQPGYQKWKYNLFQALRL